MNAKDRYVAEIEEYGRCSERYDHKKSNAAFRRMDRTLRTIRGADDKGEAVLRPLLDHANDWVRTLAATHLLPLRADLAIPVLEQIAARPRGVLRLEAELILHEWRIGRLKVP